MSIGPPGRNWQMMNKKKARMKRSGMRLSRRRNVPEQDTASSNYKVCVKKGTKAYAGSSTSDSGSYEARARAISTRRCISLTTRVQLNGAVILHGIFPVTRRNIQRSDEYCAVPARPAGVCDLSLFDRMRSGAISSSSCWCFSARVSNMCSTGVLGSSLVGPCPL